MYLCVLLERFSVKYHIDIFTSDILIDCRTLKSDQCYALKKYCKALWCWSKAAHQQGYFLHNFNDEYTSICFESQRRWPLLPYVQPRPHRLEGRAGRDEYFDLKTTVDSLLQDGRAGRLENPIIRMLAQANECYKAMCQLVTMRPTRAELSLAVHSLNSTICTYSAPNGEMILFYFCF